MIVALDVVGEFECQDCGDLARPRAERCTSCRDWQDHGVLPTTLASARAAAWECAEAAHIDRHADTDRTTRQVADRLLTLERARDRTHPRRL